MIQKMNRDGYIPSNFPECFEADGIVMEYADLGEIQVGSSRGGRLSVSSPDVLAVRLCFPELLSTFRVILTGSGNLNFVKSLQEHVR